MNNEIEMAGGACDELKLYFGDDYPVSDKITIRQPYVGDIITIGEEKYFLNVYALTAIPSDMKSALWDMGRDWTELSDLEMFFFMTRSLSPEDTSVFFGNLDLTKFELFRDMENDELVMIDHETGIKIDFYMHKKISDYLCRLHSIKKKPERPGNRYTKEILIQEDREKRLRTADKSVKSQMLPLISSMVNSPGFKYSIEEVRSMKLFAFMDSVYRIQTIKNAESLTSAYYSGNIDVKKFDTEKLNWLCDLNKK